MEIHLKLIQLTNQYAYPVVFDSQLYLRHIHDITYRVYILRYIYLHFSDDFKLE